MNVRSSVLYGWLAQSKKNQPQIRFLFEIIVVFSTLPGWGIEQRMKRLRNSNFSDVDLPRRAAAHRYLQPKRTDPSNDICTANSFTDP